MVEKKVNVCDICNNSISNQKCAFCKKDVCVNCSDHFEIGTILVITCKDCERNIKRALEKDKNVWEEFNEQNELKEKTIDYINKKVILDNLGDKEFEEEEDYENDNTQNIRKLRGKLKRKRRPLRNVEY